MVWKNKKVDSVEILYEDNHLIAINKACGELVQSDITEEPTVQDEVKAYLKKKYNKPGNVFLGLPHRLDRPTSGILLLAKTSKALGRLNTMFQKRKEIHKIYWAVVDKRPVEHTTALEHYLKKDNEKNKSFAYSKNIPGSKIARMSYRHVASTERYHLLEVELHTGRHHQIRVQLGTLNLRIKGDLKYGFPRSNKDKGIHLHARKLEFIHPVKKEPISIVADPPEDVLWNKFLDMFRNNEFSPVHPV